jgi:hypothetical protein
MAVWVHKRMQFLGLQNKYKLFKRLYCTKSFIYLYVYNNTVIILLEIVVIQIVFR